MEKATVFDPNLKIDTVRDSYVSWLYPNVELQPHYRRLTDVITEAEHYKYKFMVGAFYGCPQSHVEAP